MSLPLIINDFQHEIGCARPVLQAGSVFRACCRKLGPLANGSLTRSNGCLTGREHAFGPMFMRVLTGLTAPAPRGGGPSRLWATRPLDVVCRRSRFDRGSIFV